MKTTALMPMVLVLCFLVPGAAAAQTWQWQFTVQPPGAAPVNARSQADLSSADVALTYTARIHDRDVPISSCRANLSDIAEAQTAHHDGRTFLLIKLKPSHAAACDSGSQPIAVMPVTDDASLAHAVAAITRACCTPAVAGTPLPAARRVIAISPISARVVAAASPSPSPKPAPSPSPKPAPSPSPKPSPSPSPAAASLPHVTDWIENEGLFAFVRIRNRDNHPAIVANGMIQNCRNVDVGCGRFPSVTIPGGGTATIASVMSNAQGDAATFTYRYDVQSGALHTTTGGTSVKTGVGWRPPMTPQDVRAAEAVAIAALRGDASPAAGPPSSPAPAPSPSPAPPAFVDARLTHRGSSRLGIGIKGVAVVRVNLDASGTPQNAQIVKISNRQLAAAAIETAVSSTYAPAMHAGRAVVGTYIATFQFDGDDPALTSIPSWKRDPSPAPSTAPTPS